MVTQAFGRDLLEIGCIELGLENIEMSPNCQYGCHIDRNSVKLKAFKRNLKMKEIL